MAAGEERPRITRGGSRLFPMEIRRLRPRIYLPSVLFFAESEHSGLFFRRSPVFAGRRLMPRGGLPKLRSTIGFRPRGSRVEGSARGLCEIVRDVQLIHVAEELVLIFRLRS